MSSRGRATPTSAMAGASVSIANTGIEVSRRVRGRAIRNHTRVRRVTRRDADTPRTTAAMTMTNAATASAVSVRSNPSTNWRGSYFQYDGRNTTVTNAIETAAGKSRTPSQSPGAFTAIAIRGRTAIAIASVATRFTAISHA